MNFKDVGAWFLSKGGRKCIMGVGAGALDGRGSSMCVWKLYILLGSKCTNVFGMNAPVYPENTVSRTTSE